MKQLFEEGPAPWTDAAARAVWSEGNQGMGDDYAEHVVDANDVRRLERRCRAAEEMLTRWEQYCSCPDCDVVSHDTRAHLEAAKEMDQ
jgi:uncharacterized protein YmfQ (DUF2313 family)